MAETAPVPYSELTNSRRRGPRIEVLGQLHGQLVAMNLPLLVRNLGAGGFGVESSIAFPAGASHKFRFTTAAGVAVVVTAQAKHCHELKMEDGTTRYRAGFSFILEPGGITVRTIEILLDAATADLTLR